MHASEIKKLYPPSLSVDTKFCDMSLSGHRVLRHVGAHLLVKQGNSCKSQVMELPVILVRTKVAMQRLQTTASGVWQVVTQSSRECQRSKPYVLQQCILHVHATTLLVFHDVFCLVLYCEADVLTEQHQSSLLE